MKKPQQELLFTHTYAGRETTHRIVYIEYQDGLPHSITTDEHDGYMHHFDFEPDCKEVELFMFYESGSGGKITEIQAPHYVKGSGASYWMHPDAKFKGKPGSIKQLTFPILYHLNNNPFENGREIYGTDYCKHCDKYYDQDACPQHHVIIDGELKYADGSAVE